MVYDQDIIAAYIELCHQALEEQEAATGQWPDPLYLPLPENRHERKALDMYIDLISNIIGGAKPQVDIPVKYRAANAPGTPRGTTRGQSAACCLAYSEPIGQKTPSISQEQNGPIGSPTPDPSKTL